MSLSGEQTKILVTVVSGGLDIGTIRRLVRYALDVDPEEVVRSNLNKKDAVFDVVEYAVKKRRIKRFVESCIQENGTLEEQLREILAAAERAEVGVAQPAAAIPDPLAPYFPQTQPFVDRAELTRHLNDIWVNAKEGVVVVRGDRSTGRSHSWWRIRDLATSAGVTSYRIDVSAAPGSWTVNTMIDRIAGYLNLDRTLLKDSFAQGSTQAGALGTALVARFPLGGAVADRHCLVFDGLDRTGVDSLIIELVEAVIGEVLGGNLPGLSVVVLGYGQHGEQPFEYLIRQENLGWLSQNDIEEWLKAVAKAVGKAVQDAEIAATRQKILDGLAPPFTGVTMGELRSRVKKETVELLRRLP